MFFLLYFVWFILIELAIQKTESPTNINQQRRIRYKVQCPYSLPVGVDLSKARMCERYGSPYPGAQEQWYLEEIVDVVAAWSNAKNNHTEHKVIRYGLKTSACKKKLMITSAIYSDIGRDLLRFYSHDVYKCVAFYKEGWEYLDFSPFWFSASDFYSSMDAQQKKDLQKTKLKTEILKRYNPSLPKIEE